MKLRAIPYLALLPALLAGGAARGHHVQPAAAMLIVVFVIAGSGWGQAVLARVV